MILEDINAQLTETLKSRTLALFGFCGGIGRSIPAVSRCHESLFCIVIAPLCDQRFSECLFAEAMY